MDMDIDCRTAVYIILVILDIIALFIYKMSAPGKEMIDFITGKRKSASAVSIVWTIVLLLFIIVPYFFVAVFCGGSGGRTAGASGAASARRQRGSR